MTQSVSKLQGVIAAAATPFTATGAIDTAAYLTHCRWLLSHGCDGINVLGTTGEANSIAQQERFALIEAIGKSGLPLQQLMVGTGGCALADTVSLTRHAVHSGFAGQLILPPFYYKPVFDEGLFAFFARLIDAVRDTRLRVYLYNFPQLTGLNFSVEFIQQLTAAYPGVVVGIKDSSGDFANARAIASACPGFDVFPSTEAWLLKGREYGFIGCISATANVTSAVAGRVWASPTDALAAAGQQQISDIRAKIAALPLIPAVKFLLSRLYKSAVWERFLPPHIPLSPQQGQDLLAQVGVTDDGAILC
jgi:4-hydroxy-tetrahydrodipicolinate synthase